jgi:hypothetical protein
VVAERRAVKDLQQLPQDLPVPVDDGGCAHLEGVIVPPIALTATSGRAVELSHLASGRAVLFFYPRTGRPEEPVTAGWDAIPGARG